MPCSSDITKTETQKKTNVQTLATWKNKTEYQGRENR